MNTTPLDWSGKWHIVRADLAVSHVFAPADKIEFKKVDDIYKVVDHDGKPARYLAEAKLREVSGVPQGLSMISNDHPVPEFSKHHTRLYRSLGDKIEAFIQVNPNLPHLAGTITIPCHDFGYQAQESGAGHHDPVSIKTPIRVYQFPNVIEGGKRLLVIYKPLHPSCVNGDGTALGYDK
jgi:hypothetical protein